MSDQILRIDGASSSVPTQYHHFIPQFILKNFAHKYKPPKGKSNARAPRKPGLKLFKGDLALNHVDLTSEEPKIKESPVKRMLGMPDMYRDTTKPATEQHVVEQMLSRLESDASLVFRRITTVFEKGDGGIWLTRGERNLIRKFIFLMKYRNSKFHRRFYHETGASYEANDKHELLAYMRERGFSRPIDVWLHNMKTIIELDMDNEQRWMSELPQRMFPMDARWAIMNMESMFMNICYPSAAASEFIVTDNSYGVHEGPTNVAVDPETGELVDMGWCNFHEFAPISPRLMIVLRSSLLPSPSEDVTPWDKAQRDQWRKLAVDDVFGEDAQSLLGDLNIQKPENNYTEMIQGRRYVIPTEDGCLKSNHKFFFSFFAIETRQVNIINGIFFENASRCTSLVFKTGASFLDTLEFYMTSSDSNPFRKQVTLIPGDRNLILVKKLAAVMDQLGSTKTPTWDEISPSDPHSPTALMDIWDKWVRIQSKQLQALPDENPTEFKRTYQTLGGSMGTLLIDMEQAGRMSKLRIKIDVWSQGLDESLRARNRSTVDSMYLELPRRRVWLYVKYMRVRAPATSNDMHGIEDSDLQLQELKTRAIVDGPEDVVAKVQDVIKPGKVNKLLWIAGFNETERRKPHPIDLWPDIEHVQRTHEEWARVRKIAFNSGSIQDCGIDVIERLADEGINAMHTFRGLDTSCYACVLDLGEVLELALRMFVRRRFKLALRGRMDAELLDCFTESFFDIIYPTPPTMRQCSLGGFSVTPYM